MLKMTKLPNKPAPNRNNNSRLASNKKNNSKPASGKNNNNSKFDGFDDDSMEHAKNSGNRKAKN